MRFGVAPLLCALIASPLFAAGPAAPALDDPAQVASDPEFALQGEYTGQFDQEGQPHKLGLQVIALGKGRFKCVGYNHGLPGDGWDRSDPVVTESDLVNGSITFKSDTHQAVVSAGGAAISEIGGEIFCTLQKTIRHSPTESAPPPAGAIVLFDGKDAAHWLVGKLTQDGLLMQGTTSAESFGDHSVHIEFRLPYMPEARGQGRGNSGIYLQSRYEVQMLDSFGLAGLDNECGGLYKISAPAVNMCFPPLSWQTYDIDFTAARFDAAGKKTSNARITVRHNGVLIQDNIQLPAPTTAAPKNTESPEPGAIHLQNHGNPVRYRNIWAVKK